MFAHLPALLVFVIHSPLCGNRVAETGKRGTRRNPHINSNTNTNSNAIKVTSNGGDSLTAK